MKKAQHRFLVVIAGWSQDQWEEINHEDPGLRHPDEGPDSMRLALCGTFDHYPSAYDIDRSLTSAIKGLELADGKSEIRAYTVADDRLWEAVSRRCRWSDKLQAPGEFDDSVLPEPVCWYSNYRKTVIDAVRMGLRLQPCVPVLTTHP